MDNSNNSNDSPPPQSNQPPVENHFPGPEGNQSNRPSGNKKQLIYYLITFLVVIVIIVVLVLVLHKKSNKTTSRHPITSPVNIDKTIQVGASPSGFTPSAVSISPGTTVVWTVAGDQKYVIASNPYPKDNSFPELKSHQLINAQTYRYTFTKTGTYMYHNDLTPSENGEVVVK